MARVFWPYFRDVLRWPLIFRPGPLAALVEGIARVFDDVREDILWLRDQLNPATCEADGVDDLASGRGIERHPLETAAQFRNRAVTAYAWHRQAGKVRGMSRILEHYGYPGCSIRNMRDDDPERWAEFMPVVPVGSGLDMQDYALITWAAQETKPARSKLAGLNTRHRAANAATHSAMALVLSSVVRLEYERPDSTKVAGAVRIAWHMHIVSRIRL
jgi:P2-related tail formation protein